MNNINAIDTINKIVENKQYKEIHGVIVDLFTASVIKAVYTTLNKENKQKLNTIMNKNSEGLIKASRMAWRIKNTAIFRTSYL